MIDRAMHGIGIDEHIAPGIYTLKKDVIATRALRLKGKNVTITGNNEIISQDEAIGEEGDL